MKTGLMRWLAAIIIVFSCCAGILQAAELTTPSILLTPRLRKTIPTTPTLDRIYQFSAQEWRRSAKGEWLSPLVKTNIPFNELIYYWRVRIPRDEGFRLFLQVEFPDKTRSPWLYAGYWGTVSYVENRRIPEFDRGKLDYDQLLLTTAAVSFRFKLVDDGKKPLSAKPALGVMVTLNDPPSAFVENLSKAERISLGAPEIIHDVPLRLQVDTAGNKLIDRCQSAALASAMQYFGTTVPLEQIICWTTDPEYQSFGIWPRTIGAAHELGFDAYLDRFRDWDKVRYTVAQNKIILCSITMPQNDSYLAPPYKKMSGHIVALCGVTDDNRVVVIDSAITKQNRGYLVQWLIPDFEKIWMRNKGGVGMVICPPRGFKPKLVEHLPPFPRSIGTVGWPDDDQTTSAAP